MQRLHKSSLTLSPEDIRTIVLGKCIEIYSKYYPYVTSSGEKTTTSKAVSEIENLTEKLVKRYSTSSHDR
ncbi:MAG: hypothetical protein ABSD99_00145 [Candidatus Bathyarchaeia archaeon]